MKSGISWSPTIAMSWLWGLGFFYSVHITYNYGLVGFLAFALPNALGLAAFGWGVEHFFPQGSLKPRVQSIAKNFTSSLLAYQVLAVAITVFGFLSCFFEPAYGAIGLAIVMLLLLFSIISANLLSMATLRFAHIVYAGIAVFAALVCLVGLPASSQASVLTGHRFNASFWSLIVPMLVGFLLGPWMDIQQWQRAYEIRENGGDVKQAYAGAGVLFFILISLNAFMVLKTSTANVLLHENWGGALDAGSVLTQALASHPVLVFFYTIWASLAMISTLDSAHKATAWWLGIERKRSNHPLMALIPADLLKNAVWITGGGALVGLMASFYNASLLDLMAPFGTFFAAYAACLAFQLKDGKRFERSLCFQTALFSLVLFGIGYYAHVGFLMSAAPLVALMIVLKPQTDREVPQVQEKLPTVSSSIETIIKDNSVTAWDMTGSRNYWDGEWYNYEYIPTYGDTNSVGNIYWASYLYWVGKARELFFSLCMPDFDLKTTPFFILTNEITHKFRDEAKEFEKVMVRVRIAEYNRRFATLEHEIRKVIDGKLGSVVGKGKQKLMFVDSKEYKLLDIPAQVMTSFLPYIPTKEPATSTGD